MQQAVNAYKETSNETGALLHTQSCLLAVCAHGVMRMCVSYVCCVCAVSTHNIYLRHAQYKEMSKRGDRNVKAYQFASIASEYKI